MPVPNQIHHDAYTNEWTCIPCQRTFASEHAAHQHGRYAIIHNSEYCGRCEWLFVSPSAKSSHIANSTNHHVCPNCRTDYFNAGDLKGHMEKEYFYCNRCNSYVKDRAGQKSQRLWVEHQVAVHYMCKYCGVYFENRNNVAQHQRVHLPRDKSCYGCYRNFPSLSAMMIHLESGTCASNVTTEDIDAWALQCNWRRSYINKGPSSMRYQCPVCESPSDYVSGLMQHIESNACGADVNSSPMIGLAAFLEQRILNHSA